MPDDRSYYIGSTVIPRVKVSKPGTRTPTDPIGVTLTALRRDGVPVSPLTTDFTREALGDYSLAIPTDGYSEGTYTMVVTVSGGADKVTVLADTFVLKTP